MRSATFGLSPTDSLGLPDLELAPDGSFAYVARSSGPVFEVRVARRPEGCPPACPPPATLDVGVVSDSLALSGSTLYWTRGDSPHAASLDMANTDPSGGRRSQPDPRCGRRNSRTIAASPQARVFRITRREGPRLHACLYSRDRPFPLGFPYSDDSVIAGVLYARLAGDYAGLVVRSVSRHFDEVAEIRSYDLSRRRVTHLAQHYLGGTHNDSTVTDFELGPSGAFAYIVHCTFVCAGSPAPGFEVYLVDGPACARTPCGQRFARVDDGAGIVPDSLAVSGSALYWTKDGQPGSTPIE